LFSADQYLSLSLSLSIPSFCLLNLFLKSFSESGNAFYSLQEGKRGKLEEKHTKPNFHVVSVTHPFLTFPFYTLLFLFDSITHIRASGLLVPYWLDTRNSQLFRPPLSGGNSM
jgi:hypothetical protein